jgi:hypothetical protein
MPSRERAPKKPRAATAAADPDATTISLEWLIADNPTVVLDGLRRSIARLDWALRRDTDFVSQSLYLPGWVTKPLAVLRVRRQTFARLAWVESRLAGRTPEPIPTAPPSPAELVDQLAAGARFKLFDVAYQGLSGIASVTRSILKDVDDYLAECRAAYSDSTRLVEPWPETEAKLAEIIALERSLGEKLGSIARTLAGITGDPLRGPASEVVAEFGIDALARSLHAVKEAADTRPLNSPLMNELRFKMSNLEENVQGLYGATRANVLENMRAELAAEYAAAEESLRRHREQEANARVMGRVAEIENACGDLSGWREVGELAEKHAGAFPDGFTARWLDAGRRAMATIGEPALVDALEPVPPGETLAAIVARPDPFLVKPRWDL